MRPARPFGGSWLRSTLQPASKRKLCAGTITRAAGAARQAAAEKTQNAAATPALARRVWWMLMCLRYCRVIQVTFVTIVSHAQPRAQANMFALTRYVCCLAKQLHSQESAATVVELMNYDGPCALCLANYIVSLDVELASAGSSGRGRGAEVEKRAAAARNRHQDGFL
jgi:hypothetical protein